MVFSQNSKLWMNGTVGPLRTRPESAKNDFIKFVTATTNRRNKDNVSTLLEDLTSNGEK